MGLSQSQWEAAFLWPPPLILVPYAVVLNPNCSQQGPAYQAVFEPPNELLTEVNCTLRRQR